MSLFPKDRDLTAALDRVDLAVRASDYGLRPRDVDFRLDGFLHQHLSWRSRTSIQRLIKDGYVLVDVPSPERPDASREPVREQRPSRRLCDGARVVVLIPEELRLEVSPFSSEDLVVLYEDDEVLAVDKPAGLTVHPAGRHLTDTLIQRVHARYREQGSDGTGPALDADGRVPIKLAHRLDRETSGLVLCGKDARSHTALMKDFEERRMEKEYLAIVRGVPERDGGVIDMPLGTARASEVRLKMAPVADGVSARTTWSVVERRESCALVLCRPHTGRQHQIRVHMDAIGHSLVGDKLYGVDETHFLRHAQGELDARDLRRLGMPRQALHNHALTFTQPRTGERLRVESPLPRDMRDYLNTPGN